jgi:hypothetical protein
MLLDLGQACPPHRHRSASVLERDASCYDASHVSPSFRQRHHLRIEPLFAERVAWRDPRMKNGPRGSLVKEWPHEAGRECSVVEAS